MFGECPMKIWQGSGQTFDGDVAWLSPVSKHSTNYVLVLEIMPKLRNPLATFPPKVQTNDCAVSHPKLGVSGVSHPSHVSVPSAQIVYPKPQKLLQECHPSAAIRHVSTSSWPTLLGGENPSHSITQ